MKIKLIVASNIILVYIQNIYVIKMFVLLVSTKYWLEYFLIIIF